MKLLIVGQGLAGSCVAWEAIRAGLEFDVIADPARDLRAASRVAGGSCHPISGPRFTPHWKGMEFLAAADATYREIEKSIGRAIWFPLPTAFLFEGEESRARWEKRTVAFAEHRIPWSDLPAPGSISGLKREWGGAVSSAGGALDLSALMDGTRDHLERMGCFRRGTISPQDLQPDGSGAGVTVGGVHYDRVALCQGRFVLENPEWAVQVPWGTTKGETLEIQAEGVARDGIWKRGMALIPQEGGKFRLSATFERNHSDEAPSPQGLEKLEFAMRGMLEEGEATRARVVSHQAGVRIHVRDHLPLVGNWPDLPGISVLNGLGSKGVLWAPLCAQWLLGSIISGDSSMIPSQVRADRFARGPTSAHADSSS